MIRILHLASDLGPCADGKCLSLLATGLDRASFEQRVLALGPMVPFAGPISRQGIPVQRLTARSSWDLYAFTQIAKVIREYKPQVIHAWGRLATRFAQAAPLVRYLSGVQPRYLIEPVATSGTGLSRQYGVALEAPEPDAAALRAELGVPHDAELIVASGRFDQRAGLAHAVWAFDILKYAYPEIHLVILGDGLERIRIQEIQAGLAGDDDRIHFPGIREDVPAILSLARCVWITHQLGGVNLALEAMAAGKPVLAFHNPDLARIVQDQVTGSLVRPGDRVQLAGRTCEFLDHPNSGLTLADTAQQLVESQFSSKSFIDHYVRIYHD